MKFQFVDNDSTNKSGSRKAIRSHVMKGKNLGRTIQGRGRKHAAPYEGDFFLGVQQFKQKEGIKDGRIDDDPIIDQDGNALMFPEITAVDAANTFNNPFAGEEYTYFAFPVQFTPSMRYLVYEFNTSVCNIIYPYAFCRPTDEIGSPWFKFMVADVACLHCLLAMVTTYLNMLRKPEIPDLESLEATRHFSQALRIMNPRLSKPSAAQKDSNIAIIISLAIHSIIIQDLPASVMHLQGLQRLLEFRPGGISGILECNRPLLHKICRTDVELAIAQGTRTQFGNAGLTAAAAGPVSARNLAYPLNQTCELLRQVTRELLALCRRPGRAKMAGLQYQDVLISMWQRLIDFAPLGGTRPQDLLDDVWQLALLAFLVTVTWSTSFLKNVHCRLLHKLLREHVENRALLARGDDYQALWFWVVFIYALSLPDDDSDQLPLEEIREMAQKLDVRTWEELRAKFKQFPWIGVVHDIPGKKLWELI
ncbi:hypothetical protein FSARC_1843 [Fusarium sarcochroum]|uniref:Uncharacterized protein n=1 Tax=Fusarium sarcochroum TaxID=1208366 RepID=A0A8H4U874_9HYPO|nr:hypothetical protein FSARC_1843 [Fusarium sarcochroum]